MKYLKFRIARPVVLLAFGVLTCSPQVRGEERTTNPIYRPSYEKIVDAQSYGAGADARRLTLIEKRIDAGQSQERIKMAWMLVDSKDADLSQGHVVWLSYANYSSFPKPPRRWYAHFAKDESVENDQGAENDSISIVVGWGRGNRMEVSVFRLTSLKKKLPCPIAFDDKNFEAWPEGDLPLATQSMSILGDQAMVTGVVVAGKAPVLEISVTGKVSAKRENRKHEYVSSTLRFDVEKKQWLDLPKDQK
jgi:hypothetical protein